MNHNSSGPGRNAVPRPRLLLVSDGAASRSTVKCLKENNWDVQVESRGDRAAARLREEIFDGVLLDARLPGVNAFVVCRHLRQEFKGPLIVLSTQDDEQDEVKAFEHGADDYFSNLRHQRALVARLQARIRQATLQEQAATAERHVSELIEVNGLCINPSNRTVRLNHQPIDLSTAEFDLLWLLASHPGRVLERQWLYEKLQGIPYDGQDRSIDQRISRVRKKLADDSLHPKLIKSVRGVGYMLAMDAGNQEQSRESV